MQTSKEYARLSVREAAKRLLAIENPIVFIHRRPDGDAVGSGAALCEVFRQLGKKSAIMCADKIPARLEFILKKLDVSVAKSASGCSAVSIDVASPSQLGALTELMAPPVFMIDHHAVGEQFADGYIDPEASSAAEALADIISELSAMNRINLTDKLAYALYAAVSSDTGCFAYSNASTKTHRLAAMLIEKGIDAAEINHRLFNSKSDSQIKAEGFVATKMKTLFSGKLAYATVSIAEMEAHGLCAEDFDTAIDIVRALEGAEIALLVKENEGGELKASMRSTGADVSAIAKEFGGGGHVRAAGCSIKADSLADAAEMIIEKIKEII